MNTFPFKKLFFACIFCTIPFSILESFLALFKIVPVNFNNIPRTGLIGFIIPILFIPFLGTMFSGFSWLFLNLGYWFYGVTLKVFKKKDKANL
jgi:hypothetical protein